MAASRPSIADRLYRALLRLFPAEFRGDFGDDMVDDFRDQRQDAYRARGIAGVVRVWLSALGDVARRAPGEQADACLADARYALRMMRRHAASSAVIVALLAVGIGANITVFSFADPMLRRPLPVPGGHELVRLIVAGREGSQTFSYPFYEDLLERNRTFAGLAAHQYTVVSVGTGDTATAAGGEAVTGTYFDVLGIRPILGRAIHPSDDTDVGAHPVVVISYGLWQERFGGARDVIGRTAHLNGHPFEIIGVAPRAFPGSYTAFASRFWAPVTRYRQIRPQDLSLDQRGWEWLSLTARLRPGVSFADADRDLARIKIDLDRQFPPGGESPYRVVAASGLPEGPRSTASSMLAFAATLAGLVLLVTCANVAGVLHARAVDCLRETSIRHALGASRVRMVRQGLTEALCLAFVAATAGLLVAHWMHLGLIHLVKTQVPQEPAAVAALDGRLLAFTLAVAIVAALLFGLIPTLRSAARGGIALRETAAAVTGSRRGVRLTRFLVSVQVCVCFCLLVAAGLLTRSLQNARAFDPGFESTGLVVANVDLKRYGYDAGRGARFYRALAERLRAHPEVRAVSNALVVPLGGSVERLGFRIPGYVPEDGKTIRPIDVNIVGPDYFAAIGIPILRGRGFNDVERPDSRGVAVVNETMARRFWPSSDAVGQSIILAGTPARTLDVIGVARDIKYYSLDDPPRPYVYLSAVQSGAPAPVLHVRVSPPAEAFVKVVKQEATAIDPSIVLDQAMTFEELRQQPLVLRRMMTIVAGAFGLLALSLAIVGIYGTMSAVVGQRTREIGVRMAFGAGVADVYTLVLRDGLTPVIVGLVCGLAGASVVTRLIASQLFGVTGSDPVTLGVAIAAVLIPAFAALSLPARRATHVDPIAVLRDA
jgi:putative ABC transport system permease protein